MRTIALSCAGGAAGITALELLRQDQDLRLVAFDADPNSFAQVIADDFHLVASPLTEPSYGEALLGALVNCNAEVLLPCHSGELAHLASLDSVLSRHGIKWPKPFPGPLDILLDKLSLYGALGRAGIPVPSYSIADAVRAFPSERVVFKRRTGGGSRGLSFAGPGEPVPTSVTSEPTTYVEQVAIDGLEVSLDGVVLTNGNVLGPIGRVRVAVRNGLAIVSESIDLGTEGRDLYERVARVVGACGAMNMQAFISDGHLVGVTDVNPRFPAGGMALSAQLGLNLPSIVVQDLLFGPGHVQTNLISFRRLRHYRKWSDVFVAVDEP